METIGTFDKTDLPKVWLSKQNHVKLPSLKYLKLWPWDLKNSLAEGRENCAEVGNTWIAAETIWFLKYQFAHVFFLFKPCVVIFDGVFVYTKSRSIFLPKKTHGDPHCSKLSSLSSLASQEILNSRDSSLLLVVRKSIHGTDLSQ